MFAELVRRRVPHILGIYLGITWALLEFSDWVVQRYLLSDTLVDIVFVTLACMLPTVLMMAWFHGARGRDQWPLFEKIAVPANVVGTLALLFAVFHGKELGAAAEQVSVTDESGQTIQRLVPNESLRRHVVFFFLDDDTATVPHWLQYGLPYMVADDLSQDPFVDSNSLYSFGSFGGFNLYWQLRRRGFEDALNVPVPLAREVASDYSRQFFVTGKVSRANDRLAATMVLYSVSPARELGRVEASADDPFTLADQLAAAIKPYLDVHSLGGKVADDLPVAEHFTDQEQAAENFFAAMNQLMLNNDWPATKAHWQAALSQDPQFADAWYFSGNQALNAGETDMAMRHINEALKFGYKLSDEQQFYAKGALYSIDSDIEKQVSLARMWSQLYPNSAQPHIYLANVYQWNGNRIDDAIEAFSIAYQLEPEQRWIVNNIARLQFSRGDFEAAMTSYQQIMEQEPDQAMPRVFAANTRIAMGDLVSARNYLEQAMLLQPELVTPILTMVDLEMREGRVAEAESLLDRAAEVAVSENQDGLVIRRRMLLARAAGQDVKAHALLAEYQEKAASYMDAIDLLITTRLQHMELIARVEGPESALEQLNRLTADLEPPFDRFSVIGRSDIYRVAGDYEQADFYNQQIAQLLEDFERPDMAFLVDWAQGGIEEGRGNYELAAQAYQRTEENLTGSVQFFDSQVYLSDIQASRARALRLAGEEGAAMTLLERLQQHAPGHPEANLQKALLLVRDGDDQAAREALAFTLDWWAEADADFEPAEQARALAQQLGMVLPAFP